MPPKWHSSVREVKSKMRFALHSGGLGHNTQEATSTKRHETCGCLQGITRHRQALASSKPSERSGSLPPLGEPTRLVCPSDAHQLFPRLDLYFVK